MDLKTCPDQVKESNVRVERNSRLVEVVGFAGILLTVILFTLRLVG
jgi:hypothetical protein